MKEEVVHGILLHITPLPTGDALLQVFTREYGKMTIRARSFENSKKRRAEIDFFRLLEISIAKGRSTWSLRSVSTEAVFLSFQDSYNLNQKGFEWLEKLRWSCPEDTEMGDLFSSIISLFGAVQSDDIQLFDILFRMQVLHHAGHIHRFDAVRGDVYFAPMDFQFSGTKDNDRMLFLENTTRQLLEWFRRAVPEDIKEKKQSLPLHLIDKVQEVVDLIERHHIGIV